MVLGWILGLAIHFLKKSFSSLRMMGFILMQLPSLIIAKKIIIVGEIFGVLQDLGDFNFFNPSWNDCWVLDYNFGYGFSFLMV